MNEAQPEFSSRQGEAENSIKAVKAVQSIPNNLKKLPLFIIQHSPQITFKVIIKVIEIRMIIQMAPQLDCRKSAGFQPATKNLTLTMLHPLSLSHVLVWIKHSAPYIKHVGKFFTMRCPREINPWEKLSTGVYNFGQNIFVLVGWTRLRWIPVGWDPRKNTL